MDTTAAVLLRRTKLTETSLIVTWFSREFGKLKTVAKGARRPGSPFAGKLDLFYQCEIQLVRSRRSELHTLKELRLLNPFEGIRRGYAATRMASYFAELIDLVTEPEHADPLIYDLAVRAFAFLNTQPPSKRALLHFESEITRILGLLPDPTPEAALAQSAGRLPDIRSDLLA